MKKKTNIIIGILLLIGVIIIGVIVIILNSNEKEKDTYKLVKIDGYQFEINDKYKYQFDKKNNYGILKSKDFLTSYIYISEKAYSDLISSSSYYTNMGSDEVDSTIEEMMFGEYDGFINVKDVYYDDIDKNFNLVIILIKLDKKKTFVFQYEKEVNDENKDILEDIKNGLLKIEKIS